MKKEEINDLTPAMKYYNENVKVIKANYSKNSLVIDCGGRSTGKSSFYADSIQHHPMHPKQMFTWFPKHEYKSDIPSKTSVVNIIAACKSISWSIRKKWLNNIDQYVIYEKTNPELLNDVKESVWKEYLKEIEKNHKLSKKGKQKKIAFGLTKKKYKN